MSDEESVVVTLRVYFMASVDCSSNDTEMPAGRPNMISLSYNVTYVLRFDATNSTHFWIFNVHTLLEEEYEPEEILITLQDALDWIMARWQQATVAALCGLVTIRALRFPTVELRDKKQQQSQQPEKRESDDQPGTDEDREGFKFEAPVTGWEIFWRLRLWILLVIAVVVFWLSPISMDPNWQFPFYTWALTSGVGWWLFNTRYGFTLDTRDLDKGWVELNEVSRDKMDQLMTDVHMVGSPCGPVALVGHMLYSRDKAHTQLELMTNSHLLEDVTSFQLKVMPTYFKHMRTIDGTVSKAMNEEVDEWKDLMKIRTGDESSSTG